MNITIVTLVVLLTRLGMSTDTSTHTHVLAIKFFTIIIPYSYSPSNFQDKIPLLVLAIKFPYDEVHVIAYSYRTLITQNKFGSIYYSNIILIIVNIISLFVM